jgi:hypothetical protein
MGIQGFFRGENADAQQKIPLVPLDFSVLQAKKVNFGNGLHVLKVFKAAGLIEQNKFVGDPTGLQALGAFTYLYAEEQYLDPLVLADYLSPSIEARNRVKFLEESTPKIKEAAQSLIGQILTEDEKESIEIKCKRLLSKKEAVASAKLRILLRQKQKIADWIDKSKDFKFSEIEKESLLKILRLLPQLREDKLHDFLIKIYAKKHPFYQKALKACIYDETLLPLYQNAHQKLGEFHDNLYKALSPENSTLIPMNPEPISLEVPIEAREEILEENSPNREIDKEDAPSLIKHNSPASALQNEIPNREDLQSQSPEIISTLEVNGEEIELPSFKSIHAKEKIKQHKVDVSRMVRIEKHLIKNSDLSLSETHEAFHISKITKYEYKMKKISFKAKLIIVAIAVIFFPLIFPIAAIALPIFLSTSLGKRAIMGVSGVATKLPTSKLSETWRNKIRSLDHVKHPNFKLSLRTQCSVDRRPWVLFTPDQGKTWRYQALRLLPGSENDWEVKIKADHEHDLQFKFFMGPKDPNNMNPTSEAQWQQTADGQNNIFSVNNFVKDTTGFITPPICENPTWR